MDLGTTYLGLDLEHPFVAGASPLSDSVDRARRLEDGGAAAIVLRSLFEEQIDAEALAHHFATEAHAHSSAEAAGWFPDVDDCVFGPDEYLDHLRRVKAAVSVPVIASLNGRTLGGWLRYAQEFERAGASALELNLFEVETDPEEGAEEIEERQVEMVEEVKRAVRIPIAVKLSPFYTSLAHFGARLAAAGADGLILFNRFYETDIDVDELEVRTHLELSQPDELLLRLRWLAVLSGRVDCSLAVTGGVHTARDAAKALLCGADAVQMVSVLLHHGPQRLKETRERLVAWMQERGYESLAQMRGAMNLTRAPDPKAFARANYMRVLQTWRMGG